MWTLGCVIVMLLLLPAVRMRVTDPNSVPANQSRLALHHFPVSRLLPPAYKRWLQKRLLAAGSPKGWTVEQLAIRQAGYSLGFALLGIVLPQRGGLLFLLLFMAIGFGLPLLQLQTPIRQREKEVRRIVRNWLILLIPLLEGNLHFQTTLFDVLRRTPGILEEECKRITLQVAGGRSLRDALWNEAQRVQVREFDLLTRVLADGDRYGPQEMASKLKELKHRMDREYQRVAKKEIRDVMVRLFFIVLLFIFVPLLVLGFIIMLQSLKQNIPM